MGKTGPVPKRSEERLRRNKDEGQDQVEKVPAIGMVEQPELLLSNPHDITYEFWVSLGKSAQARYYEPSDWGWAQAVALTLDNYVKSGKPSSMMFSALNSAMTELLVTEGSRRRVRLEVEREQSNQQAVATVSELFKERLGQ